MFLDIKRENKARYIIAVNVVEKIYCVYRIATTIISESFKDLPHLSKLIFAFTRKDLDFETKSYAWEDCIREKGFYVDKFSEIREQTNRDYEKGQDRNLCRTESQAISILATPQLFQIVAAINEDFERVDPNTLAYPIINDIGKPCWSVSIGKINQLPMNSIAAVEELIRTNTPLLLQYFETVTK